MALALLLLLAACSRAPRSLVPNVLASYPHDSDAFTQGLLYFDGRLYESTGLEGASSLREVDLESGEVIRILPLANELFGEGLARVGDELWQITWQNQRAFRYDLDTFELVRSYGYLGEGWGICYDGEALFMSDGSHQIAVRDPATFAELRRFSVTQGGEPVTRLNELECVGDTIYANIWQTDRIVEIDKGSGRVAAEIDASALLTPAERAGLPSGAVLNGIAYNPESETFYLTGKLWPKLFEVRLVPAGG
jgi:glutamine cyclotransferase